MVTTLRRLVALGIVVALIGLWGWVRLAPSQRQAQPTSRHTNADCRRCHAEVFAQWEQSQHARAFTDDVVQAAFQHFGNDRKCQTCHAPEPVFVTGLTNEVRLRATGHDSGVDCLVCHALPDGKSVAASRTIEGAPCRPLATPELTTSQACAACHVAIYKDWAASRYAAQGKSCQSCHMPATTERTGRSHLCLGGHDDALVRSGVQMATRQEAGKLIVGVTNHATGHNFPGERHNRVLFVQVLQRDAQGAITLAQQQLIKGITPFRGESSAEQLQVDQTLDLEFPIVAPAAVAEVQLLYKRFPWQADRDALVVHREEQRIKMP